MGITLFCTLFCRFCMTMTSKWLMSCFMENLNKQQWNFPFWTWIWSLRMQIHEGLCTFDRVSISMNNRDKDLKNPNLYFLSHVFIAVALLNLKVPFVALSGLSLSFETPTAITNEDSPITSPKNLRCHLNSFPLRVSSAIRVASSCGP